MGKKDKEKEKGNMSAKEKGKKKEKGKMSTPARAHGVSSNENSCSDYRCKICHKQFKTSHACRRHEKTHKDFSCSWCQKKFSSRTSANEFFEHEIKCGKKPPRHTCPVCHQAFHTQDELTTHAMSCKVGSGEEKTMKEKNGEQKNIKEKTMKETTMKEKNGEEKTMKEKDGEKDPAEGENKSKQNIPRPLPPRHPTIVKTHTTMQESVEGLEWSCALDHYIVRPINEINEIVSKTSSAADNTKEENPEKNR